MPPRDTVSARLCRVLLSALLAVGVGGCDRSAGVPASVPAPGDTLDVGEAFGQCSGGDIDGGLRSLDAILRSTPKNPDALVARGLCRWTRWDASDDQDDARDAYADLSNAIEAVENGAASSASLDQIYSHRAYVAQAMDGAWVRALEDLDRAVELAPRDPLHLLDRGVARAYARDTAAARADLDRFLALPDDIYPDRQSVAQAMLDDLDPAPPADS